MSVASSVQLTRIQIRNLGHSATRISVSDKAKLKGKERDSPGPLQVLSSVAIGDAPVTSELAVDMMPSPFILDTSIISDTTQACLEDQSFRTSVSSASSRNSTASDAAAAEDIVRSLLHAKRQMEGLKNLPWAGLADIYLFAAFVEFGITWDILVSIYPKCEYTFSRLQTAPNAY
ncbi:hypothetical protein BC829DRAFT_68990 [Chytridium lagenaria]|nr:hypothetical protein BC829DRAFT_68990 [Chytridium lagenaria]